ncbi:hypothetical protein ACTVZE_29595, partial [Pseudomonas aeruginosa]
SAPRALAVEEIREIVADYAIGEGQVAKGIGAEQHDGDLAREAGRGAARWKKVSALLAERFVRKTAAGENDT